MPKFVLNFIQPPGPPPEDIDRIMADVDELDQELRTAGLWVFAGGLAPASAAKLVRPGGDDVTVTDGPYVETAEQIGGFTIVEVHDEAEALAWAGRFALATGLPMEVRAFQ